MNGVRSTRQMRPRRYVSPWILVAARPFFRFSHGRSAYVIRVIGGRAGPVLMRDNRRRRQVLSYKGVDRRAQQSAG